MVLFIELMATHMTHEPATALIDFITEFIIYMSSTEKNIESEDSLSDASDDYIFNISMFNNYFSRQENKEQINRFCNIYGLKQEFFVTVSVTLSHWIYQLGYCDKVIKVRTT